MCRLARAINCAVEIFESSFANLCVSLRSSPRGELNLGSPSFTAGSIHESQKNCSHTHQQVVNSTFVTLSRSANERTPSQQAIWTTLSICNERVAECSEQLIESKQLRLAFSLKSCRGDICALEFERKAILINSFNFSLKTSLQSGSRY